MMRSDGSSRRDHAGEITAAAFALTLSAACAQPAAPPQAHPESAPSATATTTTTTTIVKATSCAGGEMTYLGFRGQGQPPPALLDEIHKRFPDAAVYELGEGTLGVFIAEHHSMEVRARHEAAAAAVGWKGDVVDFATVTKTCEAGFHTPVPPPPRP